jgi:hypothetical protein
MVFDSKLCHMARNKILINTRMYIKPISKPPELDLFK